MLCRDTNPWFGCEAQTSIDTVSPTLIGKFVTATADSLVPARELGDAFKAVRVGQRVGMPVRHLPARCCPPEHQRHPQRPVLVRQATHLAVLSLDNNEDGEVSGHVGLLELDGGLATGEVATGTGERGGR